MKTVVEMVDRVRKKIQKHRSNRIIEGKQWCEVYWKFNFRGSSLPVLG